MFWHDRPFLRIILFFASGIWAARMWPAQIALPQALPIIMAALFTLAALLSVIYQSTFRFVWINGLLLLLALFATGFSNAFYTLQKHNVRLYGKQAFWEGQLATEPVQGSQSLKFVVQVFRLIDKDSVFRLPVSVMAHLRTGTMPEGLHLGSQLVFEGKMTPVAPPKNPGEFDYRSYLLNRGIRYQVYIHRKGYRLLPSPDKFSLKEWFGKWRNRLLRNLRREGLGKDEYGVAAAILLGYDQLINPDVHHDFTAAGAVHILCVSGLHVGIIFLFFSLAFSFLLRFKYGKAARGILLLCAIWAYALLTGLSPSVSRAATMISLFIVADLLNRSIDPFNILAASAFLLLTIHPLLLFDVGFQLSYAAVAGILLFYFPLYRGLYFSSRLLRIMWAALVVSFSAELGVFSLAAHYFHQFPLYFLLTNLAVFGLSYIILLSGMAFLVFSWLPSAGHLFAEVLGKSVALLIFVVHKVSGLPHAAVYDLYFPWGKVVLVFFLLGAGYILFVQKNRKAVMPLLVIIVILAGMGTRQKIRRLHQDKIIVYSLRHQSAIDMVRGDQHLLLVDTATFHHPGTLDYSLKNNRIALGLKENTLPLTGSVENGRFYYKAGFGQMAGYRFFVSLPGQRDYPRLSPRIRVDALVCRPPWRTSLHELAKTLRFRYIILEASLPLWAAGKIKAEARRLHISFKDLRADGAFVHDIPAK